MKRGDKVVVYEDPITEEKEEGLAVLVNRVTTTRDCLDCERWLVHFVKDDPGAHYERWVSNHAHDGRTHNAKGKA